MKSFTDFFFIISIIDQISLVVNEIFWRVSGIRWSRFTKTDQKLLHKAINWITRTNYSIYIM